MDAGMWVEEAPPEEEEAPGEPGEPGEAGEADAASLACGCPLIAGRLPGGGLG